MKKLISAIRDYFRRRKFLRTQTINGFICLKDVECREIYHQLVASSSSVTIVAEAGEDIHAGDRVEMTMDSFCGGADPDNLPVVHKIKAPYL